ncbi:MAG: MnhB domain-containing protein [Methanobacteriaceae archaeon]
MSPILRLFALPSALIIIALGVLTILGGHITPGGGFQGGAMIAAGFILCALIYGLKDNPFEFSHSFISAVESIGALGYVLIGLFGLMFSGFFLYNLGIDFYNLIPASISTIFDYPDPTHAGIIPYLNIFIGLKVLVGLSAVVIAFMGFKTITDIENEDDDIENDTMEN